MQKELRTCIKNKSEYREVLVEAKPNYATGMMEYFGVEGFYAGELVESRRLTPAERQMAIDDNQTEVTIRKVS